MRPMVKVMCCCAALALSRAASAQDPPYEAVVVDDNVVARSGPGRQYYPTTKLHRGSTVRVLRHDYGGWYAVTPPEGSFSWVDSRSVKELGGDVGVVTADNVVVRIGSSEQNRYDILAGVQLSLNQKVRILGNAVPDKASGTRFYKIAPVRGEERWIAGRSLAPVDAEPVPGPALSQPGISQDEAGTPPQPGQSKESDLAGWDRPHQPASDSDADVGRSAIEGQADEGTEPDVAEPAMVPTPLDDQPRSAEHDEQPALAPDAALSVLQDAHRRLAQIVSHDIATWDLQPARELYRRALLQARSPHIRFAARQGLDRVDRYAALQENYEGFQRAKARAEGAGSIVEAGGPRLIAPGEPDHQADFRQAAVRRSQPEAGESRTGYSTAGATAPTPEPPVGRNPRRAIPASQDGPRQYPRVARTTWTRPGSDGPVETDSPDPIARTDDRPSRRPLVHRDMTTPTVARQRGAASLVNRLEALPERNPNVRAAVQPPDPELPAPPAVQRIAATQPSAPRTARELDGPSQPADRPTGPSEGPYDGSGTLERTAMQGLRAPEYKLADSSGRVRFYVSPALGVDLRHFLHQSVAVVGQVQYRPDLRAHHITVRQVIPLGAGSDDGRQAALPISLNAPTRRFY